ncbi:MAG: sulfite exporter TauE/SafE family protein [Paracoccaceae bacterium]|nr:sulfite exporter TauE/SafE family protein [Paracoccaceae bacterium]
MFITTLSELSVFAVIGAVFTVAFGGFLRGFLGFGAALLIVPVLSAILTPERALVIVFLIELPTVIYLMPGAYRAGDPKTVAPIILAMFFTIPFGVYFLVSADPEVIKVVISLLVLAMVGLLASGWKPKNEIRMGTMLLAGSLSGLISGAAGVGGPPFVTALMARNESAERTRSNIILSLNSMSLLTIANYFYSGLVTINLLTLSLALVPFYVVFTWYGARYFGNSGNAYFKNAALMMLTMISVVTIVLSLN